MLTLEQVSKLYRIPLTDYGPHRGNGLLLSSGCGMMMAVMDAAPGLRWCADLDTIRDPAARVADFLLMADRLVSPLAICGWFSITNPAPLRDAVLALPRVPIVYTGNIRLGVDRECDSLESFIAKIRIAAR